MKYLYWTLVWLLTLCAAPAMAQSCNSPSGFVQSDGPFNLGDQVIFGPDCNHVQSNGVSNKNFVDITASPFFAKCDGTTDDTIAIKAAIASASLQNASDGPIVLFPVANCKITATLNIGNGTTSAVSTIRGVVLQGAGMPLSADGLPFFNGYPSPAGPKLTWGGAINSTMISVNGPLQGYGIQNLILDCNSQTGVNGIVVTSASLGDNRNIETRNCGGNGIASTTNPLGGYSGVGNVDSNGSSWTNISILVPQLTGAKGLLCNGSADGTSDTDYNTFTNILIRTPGAASNFGFYMQVCDANVFNNIRASGFIGAGIGMQLDYTANSQFPNSNMFYNYEIGGSPNFVNNGSPTFVSSPNKFFGLIKSNAATAPGLAGTQALDGAWLNFVPAFSCGSGTATFTNNTSKFKTFGNITQIEIDFTIASGTTCTQVNFTLPNTPNSGGGMAGLNASSGLLSNCIIKSANTIASCNQVGATAWATGNESIFSGVYENQ